MWKCPKCETINDGEECIICGEKKPLKAPVTTGINGGANYNKSDYTGKIKPPAKKKGVPLLGILIGVIIFLLVAIIVLLLIMLLDKSGDKGEAVTTVERDTAATETIDTFDWGADFDQEEDFNFGYEEEVHSYEQEKLYVEPSYGYDDMYARYVWDVKTNPVYDSYSSENFEFTIVVPSHFVAQDENNNVFFAPDMTASMVIGSGYNYLGDTPESAMNSYINEVGGVVEYSASGETWFAASVTYDSVMHYRKCFVDENYIRYFSFDFPEEYLDIYGDYVEYIEDNFKRTDY